MTGPTVVGFGSYDTARHPRVGIVLDGLRSRGIEVTEIRHPLGFSTSERVRMLAQPWRLPVLVSRLFGVWRRLARDARAHRRRHGEPGAVIVGYMGHFDVLLARRLFPRSRIVLDHLVFAGDTASDRGAEGLRVRLLRRLDRAATNAADLVLTDTEEHRMMLPRPDNGLVVPVGARSEWYRAGSAARPPRGGALSVVFFGLFTPLQGTPVLARAFVRAVSAGADIRLTLVGSGQDADATRHALGEAEGVEWIDWVDPERLPVLVAAHDVCLGIFSSTPKGLRVVPNKVYEGLAAGCAVITSDTAPQRRMLGDGVVLVPPADDRALADALVRLASDRAALDEARGRARAAAARFDARSIVAELAEVLEKGDEG